MPRTKRKDKSRAVLRTGESQRADGTYQFRWTDSNHKRFCVYAKTLDELRYKEEQIKKDKSDGIKAEARYTTVNEVYELWKELKRGLKNNTFENYKYMYETFVRHQIGSTTMLANSEFVALLKQANTDSSKMAEVIGVSEAQLRFVTNTASGMGLIKCGSVVIPFDNQISKDTDLYRLYNTNIHEKIAEQKKKEAMLQ